MNSYAELPQAWPKPTHPRPVVCVGAGGIARAAHLPAYRALGIPVCGVFDRDPAAARALAKEFEIARVFGSLEEAIAEPGVLGEVVDVEVRVNSKTPWELWPFLRGIPRHEIVYHSIHYLDLIRAFLGEPRGVYAKAVRHPALPDYADTRSAIILDYGDWIRATVSAYHSHDYGLRHAASEIKVEGTRGCAVARIGINLSYPGGLPDTLEIAQVGSQFEPVALRGAWFPEAFEGTMSNLQRFAAGEDRELVTSVGDAFKTMALAEACYQSSAAGGVPIPSA